MYAQSRVLLRERQLVGARGGKHPFPLFCIYLPFRDTQPLQLDSDADPLSFIHHSLPTINQASRLLTSSALTRLLWISLTTLYLDPKVSSLSFKLSPL